MKNTNYIIGKNKQGFSLVELLLSVTLGAIILSSVYAALFSASRLVKDIQDRAFEKNNIEAILWELEQDLGRASMVNYNLKKKELSYFISWDFKRDNIINARQEFFIFKNEKIIQTSIDFKWPDLSSYLNGDILDLTEKRKRDTTYDLKGISEFELILENPFILKSVKLNPLNRAKKIRPRYLILRYIKFQIKKTFEKYFLLGQME